MQSRILPNMDLPSLKLSDGRPVLGDGEKSVSVTQFPFTVLRRLLDSSPINSIQKNGCWATMMFRRGFSLGGVHMKRILFLVFGGVFVVAMACGNLWAQATAQISGTVRDQTGAVLPGVEVTVTQTETGIMRIAVTNETGSYVLSNLPIGPYRLEAALPGFRTFIQTGIVLQVNGSPAINPVLEVGQVSEQVEVQANAALVETRSAASARSLRTPASSNSH